MSNFFPLTLKNSFANSVHTDQFNEALEKLKTLAEREGFSALSERTEDEYQQLIVKMNTIAQSLAREFINDQADSAYAEANTTLFSLQPKAATPMQRAFYEGTITKIFRDLDNQLSAKKGKPLHRYCGCNILEKDGTVADQLKLGSPALKGRDSKFHIPYPGQFLVDKKLQNKAALLFSWSFGGGHNAMQSALAQRYAVAGMHVYNIQTDDELMDCDPLWRLTGGRMSMRDVSNYLMYYNFRRTHRLLSWIFSGKPDPTAEEKRIRSLSQIILSRAGDIAVTCFARYIGSVEKAAARTGIPACNMPSDMDSEVYELSGGQAIKNPHFRNGMVVLDARAKAQISIPEHFVKEVGFSVRPSILKKYPAKEVEEIREKWGIAPHFRVVVISAGRDGVVNRCAEELIDNYQIEEDDRAPKIHVIVVCGTNHAEYERLRGKFSAVTHVSIRGFLEEKEMGEVYAMAADATCKGILISAKASGGTVMEGVAAGVPLLVCDRNGAAWEKENIDFVTRNSLGLAYLNDRDLAEKVRELLNFPYINPYSEMDSVQKSLEIISELIQSAEKDPIFAAIRQELSV